MTDSDFLPNMGRPAGFVEPVDVSWLFPDPDKPLPVRLVVIRLRGDTTHRPTSGDQHWMITWDVGKTDDGHMVRRKLQTVREIGVDHLTNWGAVTTSSDDQIDTCGVVLPIADMALEQRRALEQIANLTRVKRPDGKWNCQSWCQSVLEEAMRKGLLQKTEIDNAIRNGQVVEPYSPRLSPHDIPY